MFTCRGFWGKDKRMGEETVRSESRKEDMYKLGKKNQ